MKIIHANKDEGYKLAKRIQFYRDMSPTEAKRWELIEYGFSPLLIDKALTMKKDEWFDKELANVEVLSCINNATPIMQRIHPDGLHSSLGNYIADIRRILHEKHKDGLIVDYGCGAWVDISMAMAYDSDFIVMCIDKQPMPLAYSSWQLTRRKVKNEIYRIDDNELFITDKKIAMLIESTSFEHIDNIDKIFPNLVSLLDVGSLFLCNCTRLDWDSPMYDGHEINKQYAPTARAIMEKIADRYEWQPPQRVNIWDLWEVKEKYDNQK
jgi:hypothetical protein